MPTQRTLPLLELDSTFCKAHQSACSALKEQAIESSRGGKNTKIHVLINERMQLLKVILTGGQIHDSEPVFDLFDDVELVGKKILADKAYSSEQIRSYLREQGAVACIPDKVNSRIKHDFDSELYKQRNIGQKNIERGRATAKIRKHFCPKSCQIFHRAERFKLGKFRKFLNVSAKIFPDRNSVAVKPAERNYKAALTLPRIGRTTFDAFAAIEAIISATCKSEFG